MKIIVFSFSDSGYELGEKIKSLKLGDYEFKHYRSREIVGGVRSILKGNWNVVYGFIFISATGIAVRSIKDFIHDKKTDPAIIVMDDMGKYVISLLSGHIGGANELTRNLSYILKSQAIITTATDNRGMEAIDLFAKKNSYKMRNMKDVTKLTAMMVDYKKIGFYSEEDRIIQYENLYKIDDLKKIPSFIEGMIIVSSRDKIEDINLPYCQLIPKNINLGIGCRRGSKKEAIMEFIREELLKLNLLEDGLKRIGTIEVKKDEVGLLESAAELKLDLEIFTVEQISIVEEMFEKSDFVKKTVGVYSVSEPVAYLLGGELLLRKARKDGITLSISKEGEI